MKLNISKVAAIASFSLLAMLSSSVTSAETVTMQKRNTDYSIDGNNGAIQGQQVYLWDSNDDNVNQQWEEISRGGDFYSYQKRNTSLCLDGGNGGANRQAVILWPCSVANQNQHWRKTSTTRGSFRLEKRNSSRFSIDGNRGGSNRQAIYLWNSSDSNINQQWLFTELNNDSDSDSDDNSNSRPSELDGLHEDITRLADISPREILRSPIAGYLDSYSVGDRCYCQSNFDHNIVDLRVDTPVGNITVREACDIIGPGPGSRGRPVYNDIQCGNGPANDAGDEDYCPGRVDIGREGCTQIGPKWNFD